MALAVPRTTSASTAPRRHARLRHGSADAGEVGVEVALAQRAPGPHDELRHGLRSSNRSGRRSRRGDRPSTSLGHSTCACRPAARRTRGATTSSSVCLRDRRRGRRRERRRRRRPARRRGADGRRAATCAGTPAGPSVSTYGPEVVGRAAALADRGERRREHLGDDVVGVGWRSASSDRARRRAAAEVALVEHAVRRRSPSRTRRRTSASETARCHRARLTRPHRPETHPELGGSHHVGRDVHPTATPVARRERGPASRRRGTSSQLAWPPP